MKLQAYEQQHRSVPIEDILMEALKAHVGKQINLDKAASALGLSGRKVLSDALSKGTCASTTYNKLLTLLKDETVPDKAASAAKV